MMRSASAGGQAGAGVMVVRGVVAVGGDGGAEGFEEDAAGQGREVEGAGQGAVVFDPVGQAAAYPGMVVIDGTDLAVSTGEPLQLVGGHRGGQLSQAGVGGGGGDPGQG